MSDSRKPPLPAQFRHTSNLMGMIYIVHGLLLWLGSGYLGYLACHADLPLSARLALTALPVIASGFGMFYMGSLGHEGFHRNLNRNADVSMLMGMLASLGAPLFLSVGVNIYHWRHHMYTNTQRDPDLMLYRNNRSVFSKLRVSLDTNLYCIRNVWRLLTGQESLDRTFPMSVSRMRFYAGLNVALVLTTTAGYAMLALRTADLFFFFVLLPAVVAQLYWSLHPYIEHGATRDEEGANARNCASPVLTFLLMGYTYHLCHHLYPNVQTHRLPKLHRYLYEQGYLTPATTEVTFLGALRVGITRTLSMPTL